MLITASTVREFLFDSQYEFERYLKKLKGKYRTTNYQQNPDGSVYVVIYQQYNNNQLFYP